MKDTSPSVVSGMVLAGKYRVDRLLGEGGMGVVLAATNEALRQRVAIKLLRTGALANAKALGRFEREARAAASLRSEHVARVLDVGKLEDGRPYMVMEYLEGLDLGDIIDKGPPVSVQDAVDYVLQACEAIAEAHAAGIIHRDLKPKNLFLSKTVDGRPLIKVLDFGISKTEGAIEDMSLTRTTEIIGSPSYMSPEQLRASKGVDIRTDIWALGVILYELLTKKVPFMACTVTELVAVVLIEPTPDVRVARPDVPPQLAQAIALCLAKKREDRFSSVADLVRMIAPYGSGEHAGMVERVMRVSLGSGRLLPPSDTGSNPQVVLAAVGGALPISRQETAPISPSPGSPPQQWGTGPRQPTPSASPSGFPEVRGDVPPPASSARLNIHGGTSVAWGETQVDAPPNHSLARRSRLPLIAAAAALFVVLGGAGVGFVFFHRPASATEATPTPPVTPPPAASIALPDGRKDLPPAASATADTTTTETPSALPSSRVPSSEGKVLSKPGAGVRVARPAAPTPPSPGQPNNGGVANPLGKKPAGGGDDLSDIGRR